MRPSSTSFASVSFATSRRTPSKDESTTACGVSSMMKSTPVRFSRARMLRPSRPMIRPFMSSEGSSTSETVVSAAWLAATRWSASATRFRARRLASVAPPPRSGAPCGPSRGARAPPSARGGAASPRRPSCREMRSSSFSWSSLRPSSSSWSCFRCVSRSSESLLSALELGQLPVDAPLPSRARAPRS